ASLERTKQRPVSQSDTTIIRHPENLFAFWLLQLVPDSLHHVRADEQLALLVRLWNLSEGLLGEAPWLNRYVAATALRITDLATIEDTLADILEPALEKSDAAKLV